MITKIKAKTKAKLQFGNIIQPPVKCFCCMDSGLVSENVNLSDYIDGDSEVRFICTRNGCESGDKYQKAYYLSDGERKAQNSVLTQSQYQANFDDRLLSGWCDQIHRDGYSQWAESIKQKVNTQKLEAIGQWS